MCVSVYLCVRSGLDEQTVSGLCEVPESLSTEGARKREEGWAEMTARKRQRPKSAE